MGERDALGEKGISVESPLAPTQAIREKSNEEQLGPGLAAGECMLRCLEALL